MTGRRPVPLDDDAPSGRRDDPPPIRTFKPRRRPLTPARTELVAALTPVWCLDEVGPTFDPGAVFGRSAPLVVEIGIGLGDTLVEMASTEPEIDVIGIDVHTPGIAAALARIDERGLTNVRLVHGDALVFLERVAPGSLAGIRLFFPDPWPKARHRHRRMVSPERLARLVDAIAPGGFLHVATDIDDYAAQVERVCDAEDRLGGGVVARPSSRPVTRYERKGLAAGRSVTDLVFRRR